MPYLIWDFDGTLATREGGWAGTLCEVLAEAGAADGIDHEAVRPHLRQGFPWHEHDVVREPTSADAWWRSLHPLFGGAFAGACDLPTDDALRLAERVREVYLRPDAWRAFEDVGPALDTLARRGWKHLVLSNHCPELDRIIDTLGLSGAFDRVYNSALTGAEKPNPAAFERVFADYSAARHGWMIGDNPVADVQGGEAVGLRAILVRSEHPAARLCCRSLEEVADVVGAP